MRSYEKGNVVLHSLWLTACTISLPLQGCHVRQESVLPVSLKVLCLKHPVVNKGIFLPCLFSLPASFYWLLRDHPSLSTRNYEGGSGMSLRKEGFFFFFFIFLTKDLKRLGSGDEHCSESAHLEASVEQRFEASFLFSLLFCRVSKHFHFLDGNT